MIYALGCSLVDYSSSVQQCCLCCFLVLCFDSNTNLLNSGLYSRFDGFVSVSLGDWRNLIGSAYSGSGVYETTFTLSAEKAGKEGEIDLGDVRFAAQVYLNGYSLGATLMPPYRLKIPCGLLEKNNKLKIIVTNTSANWYDHTDYFDKWNIQKISPYFEAELNYANDFVSGGLYGHVMLFL